MIQKEISQEQREKRLYYSDSECYVFEADVLSCLEKEGEYEIILSRSAFFPEGGGQYGDTGCLLVLSTGAHIRITDTFERESQVVHKADAYVEPGEKVEGRIDREKRFDRMQQHTAEHIVSGIICRHRTCSNVGFHLGDEVCTMDFDCALTEDDILYAQQKANEAVCDNLPVFQIFLDQEEAREAEFRSKIELTDDLRLIRIGEVDSCACCAPHVKRTGQVGVIRLISFQKYKKGTRVCMLAGRRAVADMEKTDRNARLISRSLSVPVHETAQSVEELKEKLAQAQYMIRQQEKELAKLTAKQYAMSDCVILFSQSVSDDYMREMMNCILEQGCTFCALFSETDKDRHRFVIGSASEIPAELPEQLRRQFDAGCGGRGLMIRGSLCGKEDEIRQCLLSFVKGGDHCA